MNQFIIHVYVTVLTSHQVNIELFKHSFLFTGSVGFNSLPKHLKQCSTLIAFKKELQLCDHRALLKNSLNAKESTLFKYFPIIIITSASERKHVVEP